MRQLAFHADSLKFILDLQAKQFRQVVGKIFSLQSNPVPNDSQNVKGTTAYRVDSGEYRIIYKFDDATVFILAAGKRNDDEVYRRFKRSQ